MPGAPTIAVLLAKISILKFVFAVLSSVTKVVRFTPSENAESALGKFCSPFGPLSPSPGSLGVSPSQPRSMPLKVLS